MDAETLEKHLTSVDEWNKNWLNEGCPLPKKCPKCERLWKGSANFCGFDGTALVLRNKE